MSAETVIAAAGVSKKYCRDLRRALWYGVRDIARDLVPRGGATGLRRGEFWALDDVSFELARGESLAIAGANGAGKSTLLKILHGLLKPDRGEVRLRGRADALIELGTGFNPLLTGRENVQAGAALRGLDRTKTGELLEQVIDFTELGSAIDAPLQSYSSGMKARLSYALAAQLEPDVLLVDEVLAVGDLAFQRKCATHMLAYLNRGGALLLVSHNTYQIQSICRRGILLDRGRVAFRGTAVDTINAMLAANRTGANAAPPRAPAIGPVVIEDVTAAAAGGDTIRTGEPLRVTVRYRTSERLEVVWGFGIRSADQWVPIAGEYDMHPRTLEPGSGELSCVIPRLPLLGGSYTLRAAIVDALSLQPLALYGWQDAPAPLEVHSSPGVLTNAQLASSQLVTVDVDWN